MANFDLSKAIFAQVDANHDGSIDPNEFLSWAARGVGAGGLNASPYHQLTTSGTGRLDAESILAVSGSAGIPEVEATESSGFAGAGAVSGYETSHSSQNGFAVSGGLENAYATSSSSQEYAQTGGATLGTGSVQHTTQYASSNGIYNDPNPQIIRRAATANAVTYQQKITVRFLQPPAVPPPGPLIIKEVRPPQPPPPPPLVVRQRAPAPPQPPPLILRERPPQPPASVASQTVVRHLTALPVPPRSVIIERLPPLPPKPRDIIIERWIPYGAQAKRRTIVQRAAAAKEYARPRNIIIMYDAVQARVVRQFQRLGVTQENPQAYVSRYGTSLLDGSVLLQQARAAGVVEDLAPPAGAQFSSSSYSAEASSLSGQDISAAGGGGSIGLEGNQVIGGGGENYGSQSFSSSSSFSGEGASIGSAGFNLAAASFAAADTNRDGSLDQEEFQRFFKGGL